MSGLAADGRGRDADRDEDGATDAQDAIGRAIWSAEARAMARVSEAQRTAADLQADAAAELGEVIHAVKRGCRSYEVRAFHDGVLRLRLLCDGEEMGGGGYPNDPDEVREAMAAGDAYLAAYEDPDEQARPFTLAGSPAEGHWGPDTLPASQAGLVDEASAPEGLNARWTTDTAAIDRARKSLPSPRYVLRQELRQRQRQLAEWQQRDFIEREFQRQARLVRRFAPVLKLMAESAEGQAARIHCTDPTNDEWKARWQAADPWGFELWKQACAVLAKVGQ